MNNTVKTKHSNILETIKLHGSENLRFLILMSPLRKVNFFGTVIFGYTSSTDKEVPQICRITEDRYKLQDNCSQNCVQLRADAHKIQLKAEDTNFGKESFYISDFNSLVDQGCIRVFIEV